MKVLLVEPNTIPREIEIAPGVKSLQDIVGGTFSATYPYEDPVGLVVNDDGKYLGLPLNRAIRDENGVAYDTIAGNFLVVGLKANDFTDLSPALMEKYRELFYEPEIFIEFENQLLVFKVPRYAFDTPSN